MLAPPTGLISINGAPGQRLSKEQQKFNRLVGQIAERRNQLLVWESVLPRCATIYAQKLHPLDGELDALHQRLPVVLARAHGMKELSRSIRKQLSAMIRDMISQLPDELVTAEHKELYNTHSRSDFDDDRAEDKALMKGVLGELTGVDLDDVDDFTSSDDLLEQAARKFQAQQHSGHEPSASAGGRKKTAKQLAKEAAREAEEKSVTQTVRELYRKLASALHPDRETDPQERARKTDLMQRTNDAYNQGNLLQLLELQWELEQIDPGALAKLPVQKLKHYLLVLKDQLAQLDEELRHVEMRTAAQFQLDAFARINPSNLPRRLEEMAVNRAKAVRNLKRELDLLKDAPAVRAFVRAYQEQAREAFDDFPF